MSISAAIKPSYNILQCISLLQEFSHVY